MKITNIGYNHCHDADFFIDRPNGTDDFLLLLMKTPAKFNINNNVIEAEENSIFIYNKNTPQKYTGAPHKFENDWINFDMSEKELQEFKKLEIPFNMPIKIDAQTELSYFIRSISYEFFSNGLHKDKVINAYMEILFCKISENILKRDKRTPQTSYDMLSTIRNKIYAKPYEERNVDSTAHEIRMSRSHFQHMYKSHFGVSFIEDLINSRIEFAKHHLEETDLTVKQISEICGYKTFAHFDRQFKKKAGISPLEYRELKK